ncbi:hypothetical protein [Butyrivibrio sp. NC3005]
MPSSIHEILLVRDDGSMNRAELEDQGTRQKDQSEGMAERT